MSIDCRPAGMYRGQGICGWRYGGLVGLLLLLVGTRPQPGSASPASLSALLQGGAAGDVSTSLLFVPLCEPGESVGFHPDLELPPASVQKIVTSIAALDLLGPDHRFTTSLLADRAPRDGALEGNLYLKGGGDPFLVSERLWLFAQEVAATGLRTVGGALVVESLPVADLDSLRRAEKTESPYAAPVATLGVNFNSLTFLIRPGRRVGEDATVSLEPFPVPTVTIRGSVRTAPADPPPEPIQALGSRDPNGEMWTFSGAVAIGSAPSRIYRASKNPALLAGGIFAGFLEERGIGIPSVALGRAPEGGTLISDFSSPSLGTLIRSMNLWSNNFMADLLLASLGAEPTAGAGAARIRSWLLERTGMEALPRIVDGCGLSPANRISATQIVQLLVWASRQERVFPDLYASFPRPGGEGTLARRFQRGSVPSLRAKTGTLGDHGVSSIAGYVDMADGARYAFCILQQAPPGSSLRVADLRGREEEWLREFVSP